MNFAIFYLSGVAHVLFFLWPCSPGEITGQAYEDIECAAIQSVDYDVNIATLYCIDGKIWAQCPM